MSTPKMRGFKQMFLTLKIYNSNKFVDGKKVEYAHQLGKGIQTRHNNNRQQFKDNVSDKCFWQLIMTYAVNGGRWGSSWQYGLGEAAQSLKDPLQPAKPHPVLRKYWIPDKLVPCDRIEIREYFTELEEQQRGMTDKFDRQTENQLMHLIGDSFGMEQCSWENFGGQPLSTQYIKSFRWHDGLKSFGVDLGVGKAQVKMVNDEICVFADAFTISHTNGQTIHVCKGNHWTLHRSNNRANWINDYFNSMDFINVNEAEMKWSLMSNICEPIFLIHNCVNFANARHTLPEPWHSMAPHKYIRNSLYWCHRLKETIARAELNVSNTPVVPCGAWYSCIKHGQCVCDECHQGDIGHDRKKWQVKWTCNTFHHPHFWVWDSANGLAIALTGTVKKWEKEKTSEW